MAEPHTEMEIVITARIPLAYAQQRKVPACKQQPAAELPPPGARADEAHPLAMRAFAAVAVADAPPRTPLRALPVAGAPPRRFCLPDRPSHAARILAARGTRILGGENRCNVVGKLQMQQRGGVSPIGSTLLIRELRSPSSSVCARGGLEQWQQKHAGIGAR